MSGGNFVVARGEFREDLCPRLSQKGYVADVLTDPAPACNVCMGDCGRDNYAPKWAGAVAALALFIAILTFLGAVAILVLLLLGLFPAGSAPAPLTAGSFGMASYGAGAQTQVMGSAQVLGTSTFSATSGNDVSLLVSAGRAEFPAATVLGDLRVYGSIVTARSQTVLSDARFKTSVRNVTQAEARNVLRCLRPVHFTWLLEPRTPDTGFIAQEVAKCVPEAVVVQQHGPDGLPAYTLDKTLLLPYIVAALAG